MATGGYSGNFKLMGKYAEHGADYLSSTTSMGEGIRMMQEVGGNVDETAMSYIPTFPMGVQTGSAKRYDRLDLYLESRRHLRQSGRQAVCQRTGSPRGCP